jgi:hypothetical protein
MDSGQITTQELATLLAEAESLAFRMALRKRKDAWLLHAIVIDAFPRKPEEEVAAFAYEYDRVVLLAGTISGAEVEALLTRGEACVNGQGDNPKEYHFQVPTLQGQALWNRYSRHNQSDMITVPWPYTRYDLSWSNREMEGNQPEFLVSDEFPFFPDLKTALFDVIYCVTSWRRDQRSQLDEKFIIRIAHPEAWMERIDVSPTALTIALAGVDREGTHLELSGPPSLRLGQRVESEGDIIWPLSTGLPPEWWAVLSRNGEWLDYYHHVDHWSTLQTPEPPPSLDLVMQVKEWIAGGENQTTEFKQEVARPDRFLRTVVGFANGEGGVILVGVSDENPAVLGFSGNLDNEKLRLTQFVRDHLTAMPPFRIEHCEVEEGKSVIVVSVEGGDAVPYGIKPTSPSQTALYYVRRGASNFIAQPGEINMIVQQRVKVSAIKDNNGFFHQGWQ